MSLQRRPDGYEVHYLSTQRISLIDTNMENTEDDFNLAERMFTNPEEYTNGPERPPENRREDHEYIWNIQAPRSPGDSTGETIITHGEGLIGQINRAGNRATYETLDYSDVMRYLSTTSIRSSDWTDAWLNNFIDPSRPVNPAPTTRRSRRRPKSKPSIESTTSFLDNIIVDDNV